jgi:hypothetical protein
MAVAVSTVPVSSMPVSNVSMSSVPMSSVADVCEAADRHRGEPGTAQR